MNEYEILDVHAVEILDACGKPTLQVTVTVKHGISGSASVPGRAFAAPFEAQELRDEEKRHMGNGVEIAVTNINTRIADKLIGINVVEQSRIDRILIHADGTEHKTRYGANALLGVSMACARAAANVLGMPLYRYLGGVHTNRLPVPFVNMVCGGLYGKTSVDFQELMLVPTGAESFSQAMEMVCECYAHLKEHLGNRNIFSGTGADGGFLLDGFTIRDALDLMMDAVHTAGYEPGEEIRLALDVGAAHLYDPHQELYYFEGESRLTGRESYRNAEEMVQYYEELMEHYPLCSIEDGMDPADIRGWKLLTYRLGDKIQLVGDALFATNANRIRKGIEKKIANAVLVKPGQAGTVSETMEAIRVAQNAGYHVMIGQRQGETEDTFAADLAVAAGTGRLKAGAPVRSERTAKYNRILMIEDATHKVSRYGMD